MGNAQVKNLRVNTEDDSHKMISPLPEKIETAVYNEKTQSPPAPWPELNSFDRKNEIKVLTKELEKVAIEQK